MSLAQTYYESDEEGIIVFENLKTKLFKAPEKNPKGKKSLG